VPAKDSQLAHPTNKRRTTTWWGIRRQRRLAR
jgi:hypothetical protein